MIRTKRGGWPYSQPPNVPFEINEESEQAQGLVLWMPLGINQPTGTQHIDRVRGLSFTENGTPVWVADGERGWSLLFDDGVPGYLTVNSAVLNAAPITFSVWFNVGNVSVSDTLASLDQGVGSSHAFFMNLFLGRVRFTSRAGDVSSNADSAVAATANIWQHAVGIEYSSNLRAAFINGGGKGTNANASTPNPGSIDNTYIGRWAFGDYFDGRLSDIRIYNIDKTDIEVYKMFRNPWELIRPLIRMWAGWSPVPVAVRQPRYGFVNFQGPGVL